jgi:hypothetical protein
VGSGVNESRLKADRQVAVAVNIMSLKTRTISFVAILALCSSCSMFTTKWSPAADPLKGWNSWTEYGEASHPAVYGGRETTLVQRPQPAKHFPLNKTIKDDYQNYLHKHEPGYFSVTGAAFYEDGTGQHAVKIEVGRNGSYTVYIFMYDNHNVRTKIMRFANGGYAC